MTLNRYIQIFLLLLMGFSFAVARAQTYAPSGNAIPSTNANSVAGTLVASTPAGCITLSANLSIGATDAGTDGAVTRLQNFLADRGFFSRANLGTGRFGPMTRGAVIAFQKSRGVPATGFVGPLTRAAISSFGCGINPSPLPIPAPISAPDLVSIEPASVSTGDTVTITGYDLTPPNTVLIDGMTAARNAPVTSTLSVSCMAGDSTCKAGIRQTITFTVPELIMPICPPGMFCAQVMRPIVPGKYLLQVSTSAGISDAIILTIEP